MQASYKITPICSIPELLQESQSRLPPRENPSCKSEFVDLATLDANLCFDIRYATSDNFMSTPLYSAPKAYLQKPAAEALLRANRRLEKEGYGMVIYDGYRPWYITWVMWNATPDDQKIFLGDPAQGSKHNRGCAIDLGMYSLETLQAVDFPSGFDEMTPRAFSDYPGGTKEQTLHRQILRTAMEAEDFTVHPNEWWHFDYKEWMLYGIENKKFEEMS